MVASSPISDIGWASIVKVILDNSSFKQGAIALLFNVKSTAPISPIAGV